jgi:hexosaminidase
MLRTKFGVLTGLLLGLISSSTFANSANSAQVTFTVDQNNPDSTYSAHFTINNTSERPLTHWTLWFNTCFAITSTSDASLIHDDGDFYGLAASQSNETIPVGGSVTIHVTGQSSVLKYSSSPSGYFLTTSSQQNTQPQIISVNASTQLLPSQDQNDYSQNINQQNTSIEGNPAATNLSVDETRIVPLPAQMTRLEGEFKINRGTRVVVQANNPDAIKTAQFLVNSLTPALGYSLKITTLPSNRKMLANSILLTFDKSSADLGNEGYLMSVNPMAVAIRANTSAGLFYGVESLRQLLPPEIFSSSPQNLTWTIPAVAIKDYPRFGYRGLHLDVARNFFNANQVKRLLDLMALHKLNTFHWHLADDEGWRIEIKHYPQLTNIGAYRGFGMTLDPAYGSGPSSSGGYYTQDQIRDIVSYAQDRHITIIPEIEIPGHAHAMVKSLPDYFVDPTDHSVYTSVQGYHDNVVSPCRDETYTALNNILGEIAQLFPNPSISIGGDEVPNGAWSDWSQSKLCQAFIQRNQISVSSPQDLENYFLKRVQDIIESKHKKMAGYDDISADPQLNANNASVFTWNYKSDNSNVINEANMGYNVILMPAEYLYFDLAYNADAEEPGFNWAGYTDAYTPYSYTPITSSMSQNVVSKIKGVEGALWSENLISQDRLDYMAFPKVASLAELAWTPANRRNWANFSARLGQMHLPRLDAYGVKYRLSLPGVNPQTSNLDANVQFPGLAMHYSLDGANPTMSSPLYQGPVPLTGSNAAISSFDTTGRSSRVVNTNAISP